jgi:hypothetical protein
MADDQKKTNPNAAQNLSDDDRSRGEQTPSSKQDMSQLGHKGGKAAHEGGHAHQMSNDDRNLGGNLRNDDAYSDEDL